MSLNPRLILLADLQASTIIIRKNLVLNYRFIKHQMASKFVSMAVHQEMVTIIIS